jgi:hypothetical protein
MTIAIEKLIALVLFIVVLIVVLIFTGVLKTSSDQIGSQEVLRKCCSAYVSNGCPSYDLSSPSAINAIFCDSTTLDKLVVKNNINYESLKYFCGCVD